MYFSFEGTRAHVMGVIPVSLDEGDFSGQVTVQISL